MVSEREFYSAFVLCKDIVDCLQVLMLTRLKFKRGEGQLVRAQANPKPRRAREPFPPPSITPSRVIEEASSMSSREGEAPEDIDPKEEERVF